uniref:C3H1-type domain-containing protein n=1 Tax=Lactuca sativa TaxID=4236 RepID=A0A9R1VFL9_LACSA|nr:hypothetical protein LSAT_V11C500296670 [Lactuca sativa]
MAGSMPYPDRPGEPDCIFCVRTGLCGYGNICRFNHPTHIGQANQLQLGGELPDRVGEPDCVMGTCKYGSTCKYNNPRDKRGRKNLCTGSCKFGVACNFHHPQPSMDGSNIQLPYPSQPPPLINGGSTWSLPRATYVSDPLLQIPQTYLPIVLPHSQGIGPTQGWSTYMGSLSLVSSGSIYGGPGSIEQPYSSGSTNLPERPREPECRYFMHTGNCKYGSNCKYHHPKEKIAQLAASSLG